jgi:hypothetical protein
VSELREALVFDVFEEPQANRFKETRRDLTGEIAGSIQNNRHYCVGQFQMAVMTLSGPAIPILPTDPPEGASEHALLAWDAELDEYFEREARPRAEALEDLRHGAGPVALERRPDYVALREERNGVELLRAVKSISYSYPAGMYYRKASYHARREFYMFKQGPDLSLQEYKDKFMKRWEIVEIVETVAGLGIAGPPYLQKKDGSLQLIWPASGQGEADTVDLATAFIEQADPARFESLRRDLHKTYLLGSEYYPKTVHDAFQVLTAWIATEPEGRADGRRRRRAGVLCFRCRQRGHCHNACPLNNESADEASARTEYAL